MISKVGVCREGSQKAREEKVGQGGVSLKFRQSC